MKKEKNFILIDNVNNTKSYFNNANEIENFINITKFIHKKMNIKTIIRIIKTLSNKTIIEINKEGVEV